MLANRKMNFDIAELPADRRQLGLALKLAFPEILFLRSLDFTPPEEAVAFSPDSAQQAQRKT